MATHHLQGNNRERTLPANTWWIFTPGRWDITQYCIRWALTWSNRSVLMRLSCLVFAVVSCKFNIYCARLRAKLIAAFEPCQVTNEVLSLGPTGFHYFYKSQCGSPTTVTAVDFLLFSLQVPWCSCSAQITENYYAAKQNANFQHHL